jgi:ribosomal protein S18 acetylase RimI-like enzyme
MSISIRPYEDRDRDAVIAALVGIQEHERAMHDTRVPGAGVTPTYFAGLLKDVAEQSGAIFVAERDGVLVGVVAGYVDSFPTPMETEDSCLYGYCSDIYVAPAERGSALAQRLLDQLERHLAAQAPIRRFRICALAMNRLATRAYEKAGFTPYEVIYERLVRR